MNPGARRTLRSWLLVPVVALLLAILAKSYLFDIYRIPSDSMAPALQPGDRLLCNKFSWKTGLWQPKINDVVVFRSPTMDGPIADKFLATKRVSRVPRPEDLPPEAWVVDTIWRGGQAKFSPRSGDTLVFQTTDLDVLPLPYRRLLVIEAQRGNQIVERQLVLSQDYYFVTGDAPDSRDSNEWGYLPTDHLVGKAEFIVWSDWQPDARPEDFGFNPKRFLRPVK